MALCNICVWTLGVNLTGVWLLRASRKKCSVCCVLTVLQTWRAERILEIHLLRDATRMQIQMFFLWCCLRAVWTPPFTSTGPYACVMLSVASRVLCGLGLNNAKLENRKKNSSVFEKRTFLDGSCLFSTNPGTRAQKNGCSSVSRENITAWNFLYTFFYVFGLCQQLECWIFWQKGTEQAVWLTSFFTSTFAKQIVAMQIVWESSHPTEVKHEAQLLQILQCNYGELQDNVTGIACYSKLIPFFMNWVDVLCCGIGLLLFPLDVKQTTESQQMISTTFERELDQKKHGWVLRHEPVLN